MAPLGWAQTPAAGQPAEPAAGSLPSLGDAGDMTPLEERKLGDLVARDLYGDPAYLDDPIIDEYVDTIWRRLLAGAQATGELTPELAERYAWRFALLREREINAFALPGGYMGLNLGLLGVVDSRDELAAVLAHEMSHVMQRHIARMLSRQGREQPLLLAAMVAGILAGMHNPQLGSAVVVSSQALTVARQLSFSRDMEREADRVGYNTFAQAGFAPWGFVSMFEKLQAASRINDNGDWPLLRTHPMTTERIGDAQERQRSLQGRPKPAPDLEALLIAARARVLGRPGVDVLRAWAGQPDQPGFAQQPLARRAGALYAAAMAEAELRDLPRAQAKAAQLALAVAGDAPAVRQARLLQADLALRAGQPARTLELLPAAERPAGAAPQSQAGRAALLLRAQAQIRSGVAAEAAQAESALRPWLSDHPHDAGAWQVMAQASAAQGQTLRQLRAEGEVQLAHLDYAGAVDRWRAAQDFSRQQRGSNADLIEASIVDTRLREGNELLRQQQKDQKKWE